MDFIINVYYGEKFICSLGANHTGGYDNVVWWKLEELIKTYEDKELTRELFEKTIDHLPVNLCLLPNEDQPEYYADVIDFKNKVVSMPTMPIYKEDIFNEVWEGRATLRNENGKYYIVYSEEEWALENIEFENVGLLYKQILTFDEFNIVNEFYSKLMESDNEYLLNNNLIIKFNCI